MEVHATKSLTYRPDIEGLRGIAVLLVVAFHCEIPLVESGFVGVDVFFVLSGYLITRLLVTELRNTSRIALLEFYARRIRRLLPASTVSLLVTLLAAALLLAPLELGSASQAANATAVYFANMFFASESAGYFAPQIRTNPFLHTWSLAVEEQFYLFWPLVIIVGARRTAPGAGLWALLLGLTLLSLGASVWLTTSKPAFAFYGLPTRAWEFGMGGLAASLPLRGVIELPRRAWSPIACSGLALILLSASLLRVEWGFPGWIVLAPVIGTTAVLIAGSENPSQVVAVVLSAPPLRNIGALSYSWYLWHWPCLVLASAALPGLTTPGRTLVAIAALGLASLSHYLVEQPIRFHPALIGHAGRTIALGAAMTACSLVAAFVCLHWSWRLGASSPRMQAITAAPGDIATLRREECVTGLGMRDVKLCSFGNAGSATHIVLFGDSHALQWFNAIERIAQSNGWRLTTVLRYGCSATDYFVGEATAAEVADCSAWRSEALARIVALQPTLVILGSSNGRLDDDSALLDEWRAGTRRTLQALTDNRLRAVQLRDTPRPPMDIPTCLARSARHAWYPGGTCEFAADQSTYPGAFAAERDAAEGLRYVTFVDLTSRFCDGAVCAAVLDGTIVYRDQSHITGAFAASLAPALEMELRTALAQGSMDGRK